MKSYLIGSSCLIIAALYLICTAETHAASFEQNKPAKKEIALSVYLDNDLFTGNNKDGDYTGGLAVSYTGEAANDQILSKTINWINSRSLLKHLIPNKYFQTQLDLSNFEIGMLAFTPQDIKRHDAIINDRPYASLIYLTNTQHAIDLNARQGLITSLSVGFLGLALAGNIQNTLHNLFNSNTAQGWDNQIANGGELTFKYSYTLQHYLKLSNPYFQASTASGFSLGYITEGIAGISFRTGKINSPSWNFNVYNNNYGEKGNLSTPTTNQRSELYFLAGTNLKLRLYNSLLQGQFRSSKVSYNADELRPLIYELWLGVGSSFQSGVKLSYILRYQSSEIKKGQADRSFTYAELISSYRF